MLISFFHAVKTVGDQKLNDRFDILHAIEQRKQSDNEFGQTIGTPNRCF